MNTKINIKTKNFELNPEIKNHVNEKILAIEKFMSLKPNETPIVDVELEKKYGEHHKTGQVYRAEINLQYHGRVFRTESKREDMVTAVNEAQDEMIRRVRKNREKKTDLIRRGGKKIKKILRFGRE